MKRYVTGVSALLVFLFLHTLAQAETAFPLQAKRILFLGDSITHAGGYIAEIEAQFRLQGLQNRPELINLGLASETCTGLSEPDHPFPRPDVHERIDRALKLLQPDVIVACYGMNDGIYYPFNEERFQAYQRGIEAIIEKGHAIGAKVVILTPPPFDPVPVRKKLRPAGAEEYAYYAPYENYDDVLRQYAKWIMTELQGADLVVDLHTPLTKHLNEQRKTKPKYTLAPDGVHCNAAGHRMLSEAILNGWGIESREEVPDKLLSLLNKKTRLLHDAYLAKVGHKRPGNYPSPPIDFAHAQAKKMDAEIDELIQMHRNPQASTRRSNLGTMYRIHYPADLAEGKLKLYVDYYLWIPDDVDTIRGVIVHQHGCGVGASQGGQTAADDLHWQALAAKWDCALMGSTYEPRSGVNCRSWCDPRNGSGERFVQGLADFAKATDHPELNDAPWCLWGHSGGGFWASLMQAEHAEKIIAIWFRSGTAYSYWERGDIEPPRLTALAYQVPMFGNPGLKEKDHERFHVAWTGLKNMQQDYRDKGAAFFEFAGDPNSSHDCGGSRYLAIPYFDFWLEHRLPVDGAQPLRPIEPALAVWSEQLQPKLEEYRTTGFVTDTTPPPAPVNLQSTRNDDGSVTLTWSAPADIESGIKQFVIERDGKPLAQYPETPKSQFGRPLFQGQSYHDTPQKPLPTMTFTDSTAPQDRVPVYIVRTINSEGLMSN